MDSPIHGSNYNLNLMELIVQPHSPRLSPRCVQERWMNSKSQRPSISRVVPLNSSTRPVNPRLYSYRRWGYIHNKHNTEHCNNQSEMGHQHSSELGLASVRLIRSSNRWPGFTLPRVKPPFFLSSLPFSPSVLHKAVHDPPYPFKLHTDLPGAPATPDGKLAYDHPYRVHNPPPPFHSYFVPLEEPQSIDTPFTGCVYARAWDNFPLFEIRNVR